MSAVGERLRVLQVITDRDRRGAQVYATDLEEGLVALGHHVTTIALASGTSSNPLPVDVLDDRRISPRSLRGLRRAARPVDVVLAHGSSTLVACAVGLAGTDIPFVYRQISDPLFWAASLTRRTRVAAYLRAASAVVSLSSATADTVATHYRLERSRIHVIPNAVPASSFGPVTSESKEQAKRAFGIHPAQFTIASVAALVPEKGVDLLISAAARLRDAHVVVLGSGPERATLEMHAAAELADRVSFLGPETAARDVYAAADVFGLASRGGDSMPAVLIEAGLCGLPSVSTPVGAITEVVLDERTGRIVPIGDVDELSGALQILHNDPATARAMGIAARERCLNRFTIESTAPAWERVMVETLQSR